MNLLEQEIKKIEESIDEYNEVNEFAMEEGIQAIESYGIGEEAIIPLLELMERHPAAYFGMPGEIVHFIESFDPVYEEYLVESLKKFRH